MGDRILGYRPRAMGDGKRKVKGDGVLKSLRELREGMGTSR
jgi:hypothetical protein